MPKSAPLYRIDVVPLTPLYGRRDPRFSYASATPVTMGSLVSISFGRRTLSGVALESSRLPGAVPHWMKFVGPTILPDFLTPSQITLAQSLSETLYTPLGIVFKLFFPTLRKPRNAKPLVDEKPQRPKKSLSTTKKRSRSRSAVTWEAAPNDAELFRRLIVFAQTALKEKRPLCILVPEILSAELYARKLSDRFPKAVVGCLTSRRTAKEQYEIYQSVRTGRLDILVGTRQTVFAPFGALSALVVIDSEKQLSYTQWEMAPRYDAVGIAEAIAEERNSPLVRLSVAPGIEYFLPRSKKLGTPFSFDAATPLIPIDLRRTYKRSGTNQPISPDLLAAIRTTRAINKPMLILVKQRGLARFSLCAKCQTPLRCPNCEAALSETKEGYFRCLACAFRSTIFPNCRECGHMQFKSFGAGTQSIARALERTGMAEPIITIDRDEQSKKSDFQKLSTSLAQMKSSTIIIATYESAYSLPLSPLGLIALIEPDQGLFFPDFQSEERLWRELRRFGGKLAPEGKLLVQTFEPESAFWTAWANQPLETTAASLLEERQMLHYPPYYQLLRLECYPTKSLTSLQVAEQTETALTGLKLSEVEILPKYLPFNKKNRYHILIRLPREATFPSELHHFLSTLDSAIHITRNPLSLHG